MLRSTIAGLVLLMLATPVAATSGPGCLIVVNVAAGDGLSLRSKPTASAKIRDALVPGEHGIIHLDAKCTPLNRPWAERWCPVTHYDGDSVTKGWVKARFVRDSDCP